MEPLKSTQLLMISFLFMAQRFAVKCLDKRRIKMKRGESMALNERDILSRLSNPFIVNMHYCFQASTVVYYVLDLLNGNIYTVY